MSDPTPFSIRELSGDQNNVILKGRCLPYRPLSFEGSMRAEFNWYPGNPIATAQVLGAAEAPTVANGMWKDRFMKTTLDNGTPILSGQAGSVEFNGLVVADAWNAVRVVDGFRLRGQLVEVAWDEIIRQGLLIRFKHTWHRREDVEWEMEFQWISRGEPFLPVAFSVSIPIVDMVNSVLSAINDLQAAVNDIKQSINAITSVVSAIDNAVNTIQQAAQQLTNLVNSAVQLALSPVTVAKSAMAAVESIADSATNIIGTIEGIPDRVKRTSPDTSNQADAYESARLFWAAKRQARLLRAQAKRQQQELAAQSTQPLPIATFVARAGQDLRDIAVQYYGSTDGWRRLAQYNNLRGSRLNGGELITVPQLPDPSDNTGTA